MMAETSRFVAAFLVNSLWEIPVILGIAILCSRLIVRTAWAHRHILWVSALILSATVPLLAPRTLVVSRVVAATETRAITEGRADSPVVGASNEAGSWLHLQNHKRPILFNTPLIWILLSCYSGFLLYRLSILYRAWRGAKRLRRSAFHPSVSDTCSGVAEFCAHSWGRNDVLLLSSPEVVSPLTLGYRHPVIVLPKSSFLEMSPEDFASAINHELAHVRRCDYLVNLIVQGFYLPISFHPVAMLIKSHVDQTRELACDELAAEKSSSRVAYARSLLNIAQSICHGSVRTPDYSLGLFEGHAFEKRIVNLLKSTHPVSGKWSRTLALLGLGLLVSGCLAMLPLSVQVANSDSLPTNLLEFAGSWQGQFKGHTFVVLNLKDQAGKLVGTCTHTISIEKNSNGELTHVDEKNTEDQILDARLDGNKLVLKIADNGDEKKPMECAFRMTSRNRGELQVMAPDGDKWKPWKMIRTSAASEQ
jgi:beta-lactamase regulating signal transducer with metallopeptidase domain